MVVGLGGSSLPIVERRANPPTRPNRWTQLGRHLPNRWSDIGMLLVLVVLILVFDLANDMMRNGRNAITVLWPSNGILLGFLLIARTQRIAAYAVTGFVSLALWNWLAGQPLAIVWGVPAVKTVAILLTALLLRRRLGHSLDLTRPGMLAMAGFYAVAVMPLAIVVAIIGIRTGFPLDKLARQLATAFFANGLGVSVAAPLVLALYREELREQFTPARLPDTLLSFVVLAFVTATVFMQDQVPALFLTFPPLLFVVARHGFAGATLAVPIIAVIATLSTITGHGPVQLIQDGRLWQGLLLQTYLMTAAVTAYAIGVIIAERRRQDLELNVRETRARFAEAKLRHSEALYRHMSENASDIVSRFDLEGRRLYVSRSVGEILGWTPEELLELSWMSRVHPDDRAAFDAAGHKMRCGQERIASTYRYARADGSWAWIEARLRLIRDSDGEPKEYISNARDISLQKETEQALDDAMAELSVLATTDGLTGLANRRRFDETLRREWRRAMRSGESVALLMIDADHFKSYNDLYGHQQGDGCLRLIAATLSGSIRRPGDIAARYGGEEFVLILPATTLEGAHELALRVRAAIAALEHPHDGNSFGVVTVSIGCAAMVPERHSLTTQLVEAADAALYAAKRGGRNRVAVAPEPDEPVAAHLSGQETEAALRRIAS